MPYRKGMGTPAEREAALKEVWDEYGLPFGCEKNYKGLQKHVKQVFEAFRTPIIFHPGGWESSLPQWLKPRVIRERLELLEKGECDQTMNCRLYIGQ